MLLQHTHKFVHDLIAMPGTNCLSRRIIFHRRKRYLQINPKTTKYESHRCEVHEQKTYNKTPYSGKMDATRSVK